MAHLKLSKLKSNSIYYTANTNRQTTRTLEPVETRLIMVDQGMFSKVATSIEFRSCYYTSLSTSRVYSFSCCKRLSDSRVMILLGIGDEARLADHATQEEVARLVLVFGERSCWVKEDHDDVKLCLY